MNFDPIAPTIHVPPTKVGPDAHVIHSVQPALGAPLSVYLNAMVITGAQPIIIDTGTPAGKKQYLEDVFSIVEPKDVRWIFLSHEDSDHTGSLAEVLTRCPNATFVCSWALVERFSNAFNFPLSRCHWVNDGDVIDAGDRKLRAIQPPIYDSPCTRGLLDEKTGTFWAVDSFATPMPPDPVTDVADMDPKMWMEGHAMFAHHGLAPWIGMVDQQKFAARLETYRRMGIKAIATAHSPVINAKHIDAAFQLLREVPAMPPPPVPDQSVLAAILGGGPPAAEH